MAINLTAVVLYAINIWLRASGPTNLGTSLSAPVVLSIVGVALLFVSGWLGGQMGHVYGVGVEGRDVRQDIRLPHRYDPCLERGATTCSRGSIRA